MTYDLSAYAGKSVLLQFRYFTDGGVRQRRLGGHRCRGRRRHARDRRASTSHRLAARRRREDQHERQLLHRRVPHPRRLRRRCSRTATSANGLYANWVDWFSYNQGLHLIYRDTFWQDNDVASHIGDGRLDGHRRAAASPTRSPTTRPSASGGRASRCATRPSASSARRRRASGSADYDAGVDVGESVAPGKARAAVVQRRVDLLVPRVARGRDEDPAEPRRAHPGQEHERRRHDDLGGQQEVTAGVTSPGGAARRAAAVTRPRAGATGRPARPASIASCTSWSPAAPATSAA